MAQNGLIGSFFLIPLVNFYLLCFETSAEIVNTVGFIVDRYKLLLLQSQHIVAVHFSSVSLTEPKRIYSFKQTFISKIRDEHDINSRIQKLKS